MSDRTDEEFVEMLNRWFAEEAKTDEFAKSLEIYRQTFGEGLPTFPLMGRGREGIIEIVNECVSKKKDAFELGYLPSDYLSPDVYY